MNIKLQGNKPRTNEYLRERLAFIWHKYFADVTQSNMVYIYFGRKAVKRLGSIREKPCQSHGLFDTHICINGYFQDLRIPADIVDATIAHELCHYAQGFSSPLPQLCRFPHRGGSVDRELEKRGLGRLMQDEEKWLNKNWFSYIKKNSRKV